MLIRICDLSLCSTDATNLLKLKIELKSEQYGVNILILSLQYFDLWLAAVQTKRMIEVVLLQHNEVRKQRILRQAYLTWHTSLGHNQLANSHQKKSLQIKVFEK